MVPHCEISPLLKISNLHYSKILTVTPCFLFHFTQPTGYPVILQKVPNRKCLVFKLIAPENDRNWPIFHDGASLTFCGGSIFRRRPKFFGHLVGISVDYRSLQKDPEYRD